MYEEVRRSLEQCDVLEDIEHFVNLRQTGDKPAGMIGVQTNSSVPLTINQWCKLKEVIINCLPVSEQYLCLSETAPVAYENFYTGPRSPIGQPPPRMPPPAVRYTNKKKKQKKENYKVTLSLTF